MDVLLLQEYEMKKWAGVTVVTELDDGLAPLACDRNHMAQLLMSLLRGAHEALRDGGMITVRAYGSAAGNALEVEAAPAARPVLSDSAPSKDLASARRIVLDHGGRLEMRDGGATVTATFPVVGGTQS